MCQPTSLGYIGGEKRGLCFNDLNTAKLNYLSTDNGNLNNFCMFSNF